MYACMYVQMYVCTYVFIDTDLSIVTYVCMCACAEGEAMSPGGKRGGEGGRQ